MAEENSAIVIDNGTGYMKGGIGGEFAPKACFPTMLGRQRKEQLIGFDGKEMILGFEAQEKKEVLDLSNPIEKGNIVNWEDMTKLWSHTYYTELKVDPTEQPVHLTETAQANKGSREKMMEIFFEDFSVPAFYVSMQAVLALYSSGKTTGLVVDSGEGTTSIVPVYEAYSLNHAIYKPDVSGQDLTEYMKNLLQGRGLIKGTEQAMHDIAKEIKETKSYLALDYEEDLRVFDEGLGRESDFQLPDGSIINLKDELIKCPEAMFKSSLINKKFGGIHDNCFASIHKTDPELRRDLFGSINLVGGSTMFSGIEDRLVKEISALAPSSVKVRVTAPVERKYTVWIGGSILSTLGSFQTMWVSRQEYDEVGSQVVQRKCI